MDKERHILSIASYKILPPSSGGQLSIVYPQHYMGLKHEVHVISTDNNELTHKYSFKLHPIFPNSAKRYIPYYKLNEIVKLAKENKITDIYCDHPYMAPSAIKLSRKLNIPWYLRSQNIESERFRQSGKKWWPIMYAFEKYAMKKASSNFFITPEDMNWAIEHYGIAKERCYFIPYGTILERSPDGHTNAKESIAKELNLNPAKHWFYFLGALDYMPNVEAIKLILNEIMPRLDKNNIEYQILIAGKNLSAALKEQINKTANIIYTGFIPDLDLFLKACDIMLNPIISGGGIKTKAVEALGYNKTVISTINGAAGIDPAICGNKLLLSEDNNWDCFTENIITATQYESDVPQSFYEVFYWGNIADRIINIMQSNSYQEAE